MPIAGSMTRGGAVWSFGNTEDTSFIMLTEPLPLAEVDQVRATLLLQASTQEIKVRRGAIFSNDGLCWTGITTFGDTTWVTAMGYHYDSTGFDTLSSTSRFARLGVFTTNSDGSEVECIRVQMLIDLVSR